MRRELERHPPVVDNKREASRYICILHNKVNKLLHKDEYNCDPDVVLKRWHPTYPEMDDVPTIEEQLAAQKAKEQAAAAAASAAKASQQYSGATGGSGSTGNKPPGTGWSGRQSPPKAADAAADDVDSVLKQLQGCQVYCPDNDKKKF